MTKATVIAEQKLRKNRPLFFKICNSPASLMCLCLGILRRLVAVSADGLPCQPDCSHPAALHHPVTSKAEPYPVRGPESSTGCEMCSYKGHWKTKSLLQMTHQITPSIPIFQLWLYKAASTFPPAPFRTTPFIQQTAGGRYDLRAWYTCAPKATCPTYLMLFWGTAVTRRFSGGYSGPQSFPYRWSRGNYGSTNRISKLFSQ